MGNKWDDVKVYVKRPEAPAGIAAAESLVPLWEVPPEQVELRLGNHVLTRDEELEMRSERLMAERLNCVEAPLSEPKPSLLQRLLKATLDALKGKIAGADGFFATRPIGIDVTARYQPYIDWAAIASYIDFVAMKCCEVDDTSNPDLWRVNGFLEQLSAVKKIKKAKIAYTFVNTAIWLRKQVSEDMLNRQDNAQEPERLSEYVRNDPMVRALLREIVVGEDWMADPTKLKAAPKREIEAYVLDDERYWYDYNDWYANGAANCKKVGAYWIFKTITTFHNRIDWLMMKGYIPRAPIFHYTAWWFTSQYCPQLGDWLSDKLVWLASWYWNAGSVKTTWQGIKDFIAGIPDSYRPSKVYNKLPEWIQICGDRWITDQIQNINKIPRTVDVNIAWMDLAALYKLLNFTPGEDPDVPPVTDPNLDAVKKRLTAVEGAVETANAKLEALEEWARNLALK